MGQKPIGDRPLTPALTGRGGYAACMPLAGGAGAAKEIIAKCNLGLE